MFNEPKFQYLIGERVAVYSLTYKKYKFDVEIIDFYNSSLVGVPTFIAVRRDGSLVIIYKYDDKFFKSVFNFPL